MLSFASLGHLSSNLDANIHILFDIRCLIFWKNVFNVAQSIPCAKEQFFPMRFLIIEENRRFWWLVGSSQRLAGGGAKKCDIRIKYVQKNVILHRKHLHKNVIKTWNVLY